jgi:hypothetical protein
MSRAGFIVALTGLVTTIVCAVPALLLITFFGWDNTFFTVDDMVVRLTVMGSLGVIAMAAGMVMSRAGNRVR